MMILIVLILFGIITIFWRNPIVQLIYACLGALVFSIYLIYDTQLVIGKGQFSYSLDDAYLAAIQLYLDIINLFLFILQILGGRWTWLNIESILFLFWWKLMEFNWSLNSITIDINIIELKTIYKIIWYFYTLYNQLQKYKNHVLAI